MRFIYSFNNLFAYIYFIKGTDFCIVGDTKMSKAVLFSREFYDLWR